MEPEGARAVALLILHLTAWDFVSFLVLPANPSRTHMAPRENPFFLGAGACAASALRGSGRAGGSRGLQAAQHKETVKKY